MAKFTDEEMALGLKSGTKLERHRIFEQLYEESLGPIKHLILKNSGSEEAAKDIFQDAIIVLNNKLKQPDFTLTSSIKTYLYSVARFLWMNQLKKNKREAPLLDDYQFIPIEAKALVTLEQDEKSEALQGIINQLGKDCKVVLNAYYFERLRMKEIAKQMKLANEQVARNKKSKCLAQLRKLAGNSPSFQKLFKS